jgi:hypothetical protein
MLPLKDKSCMKISISNIFSRDLPTFKDLNTDSEETKV